MITPLPFDSALFGYSVGKCVVGQGWTETGFLIEAKGFQLVYLFSDAPIEPLSPRFSLVDTKLIFEKKLCGLSETKPEIRAYVGGVTDGLLALAMESGIFSRFKTDQGFTEGEFEKLYGKWIEMALEKEVVFMGPKGEGLVSVSVEGAQGKIGLLAVEAAHRGQGWGKRLVQAAEYYAHEKGADCLLIPTQEANVPACSLYRAMGYSKAQRQFVYHYR
ncbi:GNAT family N-acetyltransferase [Algoriphagus sp. H41]|uniref:GNAT family N-acetyltransferase n=1 Tax=Algoriphagus oliviformis TaxID=2811231 RepID=A0ABS3C753_9BACT|nr:GNAT family N-acetyltransferase [Algoriphagus oliviformis]MBN7812937.1 GNAT family N-acetyltransferase [Algoriphagus oliviformis]